MPASIPDDAEPAPTQVAPTDRPVPPPADTVSAVSTPAAGDPTTVTAAGTPPDPAGTAVATPAGSGGRPYSGAGGAAHRVTVPGFEIEAELGRGGMGVVYRARQVALNRTVALKMILSGQHADPVTQARFLVEAEAVAAIRHPHVVEVHEFGRHDDLPYFAMEYVSGGTLADRVRRDGRVEPAVAAGLVARLAAGVAAAHAAGIIHRDLKPGNVLLTEGGEPKVTDFGLARVGASDMTATGAVLGSPGYMSPEQAAGKVREVRAAADVWGLGAILYALLTGRPPFRGDSWQDAVQQVITADPPRPRAVVPGVPRDLETICLKCLEKDQRARYPTADAVAADLGAFLDGRPIAARPVGVAERAWKWANRHPGQAAAVAAGVVLAVGLVVAGNVIQQQRTDDRVAAETKRLDDLRDADAAARAAGLVQALGTAETAAVPRILDDLSGLRELARPGLADLAARPVGTREGLHGRLAVLADEPGRVAELAAYLPTCRPEEVLIIRRALAPHAAAVAPGLWAVLADEQADPGQRIRVAAALAGFAPADPRWPRLGPAVVKAVVRTDPGEFVAWSAALEPVRAALLPALTAGYTASRARVEGGNLSASDAAGEVGGYDRTADLLARYAADRPDHLAELAVTADPRHYRLFAAALTANRAAVGPLLKAELVKTVPFTWNDVPLQSAWVPTDPETARAVESGDGLLHERFAYAQAVPAAEFEPLAERLGRSGYRPTRVRPYRAAERELVAAVWARDGVEWKLVTRHTADGVRERDAEYRAAGFHPTDVAAWTDDAATAARAAAVTRFAAVGPAAAPALEVARYAAVWSRAPNRTPVNHLYLGLTPAAHEAEVERARGVKGTLLTVQLTNVKGEFFYRYSGVWQAGPGEPDWKIVWSAKADDYAAGGGGLTAADVSVVRGDYGIPIYAGLWREGPAVEVAQLTKLPPAELLDKARELTAAGWRPVSVGFSEQASAAVWHRPLRADAALQAAGRRRGYAAAALVVLGDEAAAWPVLAAPADGDPTAQSYLIERLAALRAEPLTLIRRFETEPDVSAKRALLLALGDYPPTAVPEAERDAFVGRLVGQYADHPDPGLHGAIDWLLRHPWKRAEALAPADRRAVAAAKARGPAPPPADKDWFVNGEGQTYAVVRGPVTFPMGSPASEPSRLTNEPFQQKRIARSFAVATRHVTHAEFEVFRKRLPWVLRYSRGGDTPALAMTWYEATEYCNWLSQREGIPAAEWCYAPTAGGKYDEGMRVKPDHLSLTGYRLPTEAEWECACRAGTATARYYGRGDELIHRYGWARRSAGERAMPAGLLRPNPLGLFDTLGNACQWVEDVNNTDVWGYDDRENPTYSEVKNDRPRFLRGGSFFNQTTHLRAAYRHWIHPNHMDDNNGFRPARTIRAE